ncbi:GDP-mannose 4,6 dehydratase [Rhizoctonia solani]|uniref:GDP-mannose 4,6 dehydratase n=1 Tax=Rhizoctonia solani TaxID=456999 RepID=A0A8H7IEB4_9AGAM|nr:GDP-mannose 4,6 dehydratase [Rhizoctonia solani]
MPSTVLLTGGNGFIAVHIISLLLSGGHSIVATVRSENKTTYLRQKFAEAIPGGQLKFAIVEDITVSGAFDEVLKSHTFDVVLHTSSPFVFTINDVKKDLLDPAVLGTTEILKAIKANAPTVKHVVVTSSFASIVDLSKGNRPGYIYSEKDWNPITYEDSQKDPVSGYYGSKKFAEKAAWDFLESEKPSFKLTTICPQWQVYGPALQEVKSMSNLNASSSAFYALFSGQQKELKNAGVWFWTDVRNVAEAHIAAFVSATLFEMRDTNESVVQLGETWNWEREVFHIEGKGERYTRAFPSAAFPETGTYYPDNSKSKTVLGIEYTPPEITIRDTLEQFVALEKELGIE